MSHHGGLISWPSSVMSTAWERARWKDGLWHTGSWQEHPRPIISTTAALVERLASHVNEVQRVYIMMKFIFCSLQLSVNLQNSRLDWPSPARGVTGSAGASSAACKLATQRMGKSLLPIVGRTGIFPKKLCPSAGRESPLSCFEAAGKDWLSHCKFAKIYFRGLSGGSECHLKSEMAVPLAMGTVEMSTASARHPAKLPLIPFNVAREPGIRDNFEIGGRVLRHALLKRAFFKSQPYRLCSMHRQSTSCQLHIALLACAYPFEAHHVSRIPGSCSHRPSEPRSNHCHPAPESGLLEHRCSTELHQRILASGY